MARDKQPYEKMRNYTETEGCILITTEEEYLNGNAETKLKFKCKCGNIFEAKLGNFRNSKKQCPDCSAKQAGLKQRLTITDLHNYIKDLDNGTILLSDNYKTNNEKLLFKCRCGNIFSCSWSNFARNQNKCSICNKKPNKWSIEKLKELLNTKDGNGCELLSNTPIISYSQKLEFKCACGNIFYRKLDSFLVGDKQCYECVKKAKSSKLKADINHIREYVKKYGCTLLSNQYENNKTKLTLQCKCGNTFITHWNTIRFGKHQCNDCGMKLKSGANNVRWKGGITPLNRQLRSSKEYKHWREQVYKRDNYTCQCCGDSKGHNLESHHIENFSENEGLRFDIDNGITLCDKCHNPNQYGSFHYVYGTHNNTREQLEEYIENKKLDNCKEN